MYRLCLVIGFLLVLGWNVGCAPEKKDTTPVAAVKGAVKIDGKPVPSGELHFGVSGVPPRVLEIKDGAFAGEAPIGKNHVELYIYVEGPADKKYGGTRSKINTAPEKYWGTNTTLEATVTDGGPNEFKFDLTSK